MAEPKVHALGTRRIAGQRQTACNSFMAEGQYAMPVSIDQAKVTCKACLKNLAKRRPVDLMAALEASLRPVDSGVVGNAEGPATS